LLQSKRSGGTWPFLGVGTTCAIIRDFINEFSLTKKNNLQTGMFEPFKKKKNWNVSTGGFNE
jgi:hypothetical protein